MAKLHIDKKWADDLVKGGLAHLSDDGTTITALKSAVGLHYKVSKGQMYTIIGVQKPKRVRKRTTKVVKAETPENGKGAIQ